MPGYAVPLELRGHLRGAGRKVGMSLPALQPPGPHWPWLRAQFVLGIKTYLAVPGQPRWGKSPPSLPHHTSPEFQLQSSRHGMTGDTEPRR